MSLDEDKEEEHEQHGYVHESPWSMTFPLVFLAVPSVIIGFMGLPWDSKFANLLDPEEAEIAKKTFELNEFLPLAIASVVIASIGIAIAYQAYFAKKINLSILFAEKFPSINQFLSNKSERKAQIDKSHKILFLYFKNRVQTYFMTLVKIFLPFKVTATFLFFGKLKRNGNINLFRYFFSNNLRDFNIEFFGCDSKISFYMNDLLLAEYLNNCCYIF